MSVAPYIRDGISRARIRMNEQYIRCAVRGTHAQAAKAADARGLPFRFVKEVRDGECVETIGKIALVYRRLVAAWFKDSIGNPDGTLLAYAVTTDAAEAAREAAHRDRIEAAKRVLVDRHKRCAVRRLRRQTDHADAVGGRFWPYGEVGASLCRPQGDVGEVPFSTSY
jgi:hypothetical protein